MLKAAAVAVTASLLLSGCFLRSLIATYEGDGSVAISGNSEVRRCPEAARNICTYWIAHPDGSIEHVSSFVLFSDFGLVGVIIDPLIVQVPASSTDVTATYNDAGTPLPLVITEATSFPVTPSLTVEAEPDTKFLILELPDAVAAAIPAEGLQFDFSLDFVVTGPADFSVKPMFTASIDQAGTRYYLPLLPCVTDFAQVPSVQLSQPTRLEDLLSQARDLMVGNPTLGCDGVTYDLRTVDAATTTTTTTTTTTATTTAPTTTTIAPTTTTTTTVPATTAAPTTTATVIPTAATQLPETGSTTAAQVWGALALLVLGASAMWLSRRHPARR